MQRRYKEVVCWCIIFSLSLFIISCQQGKSSDTKKDITEETIDNSLVWIYGHPVLFSMELAFVEVSEEIIAFYILNRNAKSPSQKDNYLRELQKRYDFIESKKDLKLNSREYTMLFAIAYIKEKLGIETLDFRKIIEEQVLSDPLLYPPHITTSIWNTLYLERLGYNPPKALGDLMPSSTLSREVRERLLLRHVRAQFDPMFIDPISITIYDMTHEIFSLTDFGELPPPLVIIENQAFFSELFNEIINWAITVKHIDVLAEAIMCVKMLDLKDVTNLQRGIEFIISSQQKDGSFGVTNPGRPNVFRHGILVSIIALSLP
ncbi:MAG: DUF6895 family protein [bacterium]